MNLVIGFTYVLLVVGACITVYCGVKFIEYSWNVIVSKTPPFVPANSIERAAYICACGWGGKNAGGGINQLGAG